LGISDSAWVPAGAACGGIQSLVCAAPLPRVRAKWSRFYFLFSLSFFINCGCPGRERARARARERKIIGNGASLLTVLPQRHSVGRRRVYSQQKQCTRWTLSATARHGNKKNILALSATGMMNVIGTSYSAKASIFFSGCGGCVLFAVQQCVFYRDGMSCHWQQKQNTRKPARLTD